MFSMYSLQSDPQQHPKGLWRSLTHLWCRHPETTITPKTGAMPAHVVCQSCGWREPLMASVPLGTRTWDSSRDEARYHREKRRRALIEDQKQLVIAQLATPAQDPQKSRRLRSGHLVDMRHAVGE